METAELVRRVLAAWDEKFTRPAEPAVDHRMAVLAVDTVLAALGTASRNNRSDTEG